MTKIRLRRHCLGFIEKHTYSNFLLHNGFYANVYHTISWPLLPSHQDNDSSIIEGTYLVYLILNCKVGLWPIEMKISILWLFVNFRLIRLLFPTNKTAERQVKLIIPCFYFLFTGFSQCTSLHSPLWPSPTPWF